MKPRTDRMSGAERREQILDAAVEEFAAHGYEATTTADIAARAGISQPYVYRFFPTKRELYIAVIDRCVARILNDWESAVPKPGESRLDTLGRTYVEAIPARRSELMVKFGAYGASHDAEIAAAMRHHLARLYRYVAHQAERDGSETPYFDAVQFIARGFFINASMVVGLESALTPEEWISVCGKSGVARIQDRLEAIEAA
jgi:TetR/AcrR family transcriptional regulator